jgi:lipoate-protein ligase A
MRLMRSGDCAPAFNLALDEALLRSGVPTFRLYGWNPPGLSLGFFQKATEFQAVEGYTLVRRPTGGGAIAHTGEVTLAWIGTRCRVEKAYATINTLVADALRTFGIEVGPGPDQPEAAPPGLCFDSHTCYDLLAGGRKVFGSAQRRGANAFLLHGTLVLEPNPLASGAVSLAELLGRDVPRDEIEQALIDAAPWDLVAGEPTPDEIERTKRLESERYADPAWTNRR